LKDVRLTFCDPTWPIMRQTPGRSGVWSSYRYCAQTNGPVDAWVVYGDLPESQTVICDPKRTILFMCEPPEVLRYPARFLAQFAVVVTSHSGLNHPGAIHVQQGLPWFVGGRFLPDSRTWDPNFSKDYDDLLVTPPPAKTKLMSIVATKKYVTPGHELRCRFIERLKDEFGDQIDVFGVGHDVVADKWDVIAPYRYYCAIENCAAKDYWTEKLSDAYLAGAYPFYYGCSNISDYFSGDAMTRIDLADFDAAIAGMRRAISEDTFENSGAAIQQAKELVLNRYQLFPAATDLLDSLPESTNASRVTLSPMKKFRRSPGSFLRKLSRIVTRRSSAAASAKESVSTSNR
jgi:hypothetical protein